MLPAVLMVLVLAVGSIMIATQRLTLNSVAAEVARHEARGDAASAVAALGSLARSESGSVGVSRSTVGPLHCVTLSTSPPSGLLAALSVSARGCAAISEAEP